MPRIIVQDMPCGFPGVLLMPEHLGMSWISAFRAVRCAVVLGAVLLGAASNASAAVPPAFWGMNATSITGRADTGTHLAAMRSVGVSWIRVDAHWHAIEPTAPVNGKHSYRWTAFDAVVRQAAAHGLEVRPMAGYSPTWASVDGHKFGAPKDPRAYAAFVKALALRYGPYGDFWQAASDCASPSCRVRGAVPIQHIEVWNEPNFSFFWHRPDPVAYAEVLDASIDAVRSVARLEPVGLTVGGLLAGTATSSKVEAGDFLRRMVAAVPSLAGRLGGIAVHAYNNDTWVVMDQVAAVRKGAVAAGLGDVPLVLNENGWTTSTSNGFFLHPVSEDTRAQKLRNMVGRVSLARTKLGLGGYGVYSWRTVELDPANGEHWFGLANQDGSLKPSAVALRGAIAETGVESPLGSGASSMFLSSKR